jgi:hypothetical protein
MVSEVPAMTLLWTGMMLMSMGVLLRPLEQYGKGVKSDADEGGPPDDGEDDGTPGNDDKIEECDQDES